MEGEAVPPSIALAMIAEGQEQVITIDKKAMLDMVMQALGARQMPIYTEINCGVDMLMVSIKMDVSNARYCVGQTVSTVEVEGEASNTKHLAERSAVMKAIKHLNERHLIDIRDFSTMVEEDLVETGDFGHVNSATGHLEKMIEQWGVTLSHSKDLAIQLAGKDACNADAEMKNKWDMYGSCKHEMASIVEIYTENIVHAKAKRQQLETQRKTYHSINIERHQAELRKGYLQTVFVPAKVVLDYVLAYIGGGKADYTNAPSSCGDVKGVAHFSIPKNKKIKICGNIQIKGRGTSTEDAEEEAAFNALLFIERKYKIRVVDLNCADRLNAEEEQRNLVNLLEQMVTLGEEVKEHWGGMVTEINNQDRKYLDDPVKLFKGETAQMYIEAYGFCAKNVGELADDSNKRYAECAEIFEKMKTLDYKLHELKIELHLD